MPRLACNRRTRTTAVALGALSVAVLLAVTSACPGEVLRPAPRELQVHLTHAREAVEAGRFVDAVLLLEAILTDEQDGFVRADAPGETQRTVKSEAAAMLAALPPEALNDYETYCGSKAQRQLTQAAAHRDREALAQLVLQYPCTAAASEAAFLLGHDGLDRGRPMEALAWLRRLADRPNEARQFEPELTLCTASAHLMAGDAQRAGQALGQLDRLGPGIRFHIGDEEFKADDDPQRMLDVLTRAVRPVELARAGQTAAWSMFRGDPARNRATDWSGTLGPLLWRVDIPGDESSATQRSTPTADLSPLPAAQPLLLGSWAVARTPQRLIAVDMRSGRQVWEHPPGGEPVNDRQPNMRNIHVLSSNASTKHAQRTYDDAPFGQLASDGRLVFFLDGLGLAGSGMANLMVVGGRVVSGVQFTSHNRLVALALQGEGKLAWSVGAESGEDEPQLAGAFFLGPPLVHHGRLYVLAERNEEIHLCTLDAATGRLMWSVLLAVPPQPIAADARRRLAGATPSLAEGVLVCPTSAGAVLGVDAAARSILWGHQYPVTKEPSRAMVLRLGFGAMSGGLPQLPTRCTDATATIAGGQILLAPVESDELLCLDLHSGTLNWKRPLGDGLYVACVADDTVLVVGNHALSGWDLRTGKPAWDELAIELPDDSHPAGRGCLADSHYYLPTTAPSLLRLHVATGRLVDSLPLETRPGNLVAAGSLVVSQSPQAIEAFEARGTPSDAAEE